MQIFPQVRRISIRRFDCGVFVVAGVVCSSLVMARATTGGAPSTERLQAPRAGLLQRVANLLLHLLLSVALIQDVHVDRAAAGQVLASLVTPSSTARAPITSNPAAATVPIAAPATGPAAAASPNATTAGDSGVLDPAQVLALQALGLPAGPGVCATAQPTQLRCDNDEPLHHVTLLRLQYCSPAATLSESALANLSSSLTSLSFLDCPVSVVPWPRALAQSLTSFTVSASLGRTADHPELEPLPAWWIGRLHNLQQLTVLDVMVNATSADVILSNMTALTELTILNGALSGSFPNAWSATNLTVLDLSNNRIAGEISPDLSTLSQLRHLNLALNFLTGTIPAELGALRNLNKLQLNGNKLSGPVPVTFANLSNLVYFDVSNNQLNGSVPVLIGEISGLRYLDLSNNSFQGPIPFTPLFLAQLNTFQVTGNPQLCFNSTLLAAKLAGGLPPCDSTGLPDVVPSSNGFAPASPPIAHPGYSAAQSHQKGPSTLVWAAGIGVGVVVLLIVVIVIGHRCCASGKD